MEERQTLRQATKLWREAYRYQIGGKLDRAIELYRHSIRKDGKVHSVGCVRALAVQVSREHRQGVKPSGTVPWTS